MPQPTPDPTGVSPADPDALTDALQVKIGDAVAVLRPNQDIPPASNVSEQPQVVVQRAQTQTTNGSTAQIPLSLSASVDLSRLFAKVTGADSYFEVDLSGNSTKRAIAEQTAVHRANTGAKLDTVANLELALPPDVSAGQFGFEVAVVDVENRISQRASGTVQITTVGTGVVQVSLSWDAFADLDLGVIDPLGNRIDFTSPSSPSGGALDVDDVDGGPGSVENIFWTEAAPNGQYEVEVDYFGGVEAANFVVTVSAGGSVIGTVSRNNFQESDGCIRVFSFDLASGTGTPFPGGACSISVSAAATK